MPRILAIGLAFAFAPTLLPAQETAASEASWKWFGEIRLGSAENPTVAAAIRYAEEMIAAGVADGAPENWACRTFLTKESLAATPLQFKLMRDGNDTRRAPEPYMHWDYEKPIDLGAMFAPMRPVALAKQGAFKVKGMHICSVPRPGGGFRMNFGGKAIMGAAAAENPLLTGYQDIEVHPPHRKLMARLRSMPIYASMDLTPLVDRRDLTEIASLFGPKAALVSAAVTTTGTRPVVDLYSAMGPGDGIVGQFLDPKPRVARVLGSLPFPPGILLAADLGPKVPRSLSTLSRGAPAGLRKTLASLDELLECWDGTLTLVATGAKLPAKLPAEIDPEQTMETLVSSLRGTLLLGIEDGAGDEIVTGLETVLGEIGADLGIESVGAGDRLVYRVPGRKFVALGSSESLFALSVGDSQEQCLAQRTACLAKGGQVPTPPKFGMVPGPVVLWVDREPLRYVGAMFRGLRRVLSGSSSEHMADWIQTTLERDLLSEPLAASLSWSQRIGVMLRVMF